jgi:16S rRNA (cytosine967-C5)-methyltransferase
MTLRANQLAGLAAAIAEVRPLTAPADVLLYRFFRQRHAIGRADRAVIADGVYAYLRRKRSLEAEVASTDPHRLALAVAVLLLGHSVRELGAVVSAADAQWLAEFKARGSAGLPPAVAADLPDWLWARLGEALGDTERAALARAWQAPAPLDLRVNSIRMTRDAARAALAASGIDAAPMPYSPLGLRIAARTALAQHPLFIDGSLEIQDEGSQLVGFLVAPRRTDMVADFCAGAGGKTLLLGALMRSHGRLYAFDVVAKRLANLKPRLARSGLSNVHPQLLASGRDAKIKRLAGKLDRVLVDAPCTGFGTLRRNPDLKWRHAESAVAELAQKQRTILANAATLVKPGGRLVYATCSVLPEENEGVVAAFLAAHPGFAEGNAAAELARAGIALDTGPQLRIYPHRHGCDGFFAAILERRQ